MQTLKEFNYKMSWSMLSDILTQEDMKALYESVDEESYVSIHEVYEDFEFETVIVDVNFHSVLEDFSELIEDGHADKLQFYYLMQEDMYAGVVYYNY